MKNCGNYFKLVVSVMILATLTACAPMQRAVTREVFSYREGQITNLEASGVCWMMLKGAINSETATAFRSATIDVLGRKCLERWVFLESGGGSLNAAFEIGRIIRNNKFNTTLEKGLGSCASACGMIFIAGVKRELPVPLLEGRVGFHQPSIIRGGKRECQTHSSMASKAIMDYASEMLTESAAKIFHESVMATECSGLKVYSYKHLVERGIATAIGGPDVF